MDDWSIAEDIAVAQTPPAHAYCSADVMEQERERLFASSWLGLPPLRTEPGWVTPVKLLPGILDDGLCLATDARGEERLLSNVCTHRAMPLVSEPGPARRLRCGYHGRRFSLCGRLEGAPGFEGAVGFPSSDDDLPRLSLERLGPLRFGSLMPSLAFEDWVRPYRPWLEGLPIDGLARVPASTRAYSVEANWKLYLDNYLEGFHIPTVHKGLAAALDVSRYEVHLVGQGSVQVGRVSEDEPVLDLGARHPLFGQSVGALYMHLFPNTLLNFYPWGLSVNHVRPVSPQRTEVTFESYIWSEERVGLGAGADLDRVEREDEAVVEGVQTGLRSRLYRRGRYAPAHERAVHHFHRVWLERLKGSVDSG